jgi:hypothetical protein
MKPPFWKVIICSRQISGERVEAIDCFVREQEARDHAELLRTSDLGLYVRVQRVDESSLRAASGRAEESDQGVGWPLPIRPHVDRLSPKTRSPRKRDCASSRERL